MAEQQDLSSLIKSTARQVFAAKGYASTTMKSVAAVAGVAPTVVKSLYANKEDLFVAAMRLPFEPSKAIPDLIAPGIDGLGDRLVEFMLRLMADEQARGDIAELAATGSQFASAGQTSALIEFFQDNVIDTIVAALGIPDARLRGALITAELGGIAAMRYIVKVEPLASLAEHEIVRLIGPRVQELLDPRKPL